MIVPITLLNPLGAALLHYRQELVSVLQASGQDPDLIEFPEPSADRGTSRSRWVAHYISALWSLKRANKRANRATRVIVTWPVLGYLDLIPLAALLPDAWLTVHDPVPLVRAIGYGAITRRVVRLLGPAAKIVVLSEDAAEAVRAVLPKAKLRVLAHPVLAPTSSGAKDRGGATVRVLGQFKPDRDLDMLRAVAASTSAANLTITGRGWPPVEGWELDSRFVSEQELDELIRTASAVLIPYKRFFQSGIAIRCLELGTPVVGPRASSLLTLMTNRSELLAADTPASWSRAIENAINLQITDVLELGYKARDTSVRQWSVFAQEGSLAEQADPKHGSI